MNQKKKAVSLKALSQVLFQSVCHSCLFLSSFKDFDHIIWKDPQNPVTEVNFQTSQAYLTQSIQAGLGEYQIRIVGEEDLSFADFPELQAVVCEKMKGASAAIHHSLHPQISFNQQLYESDGLNLWIDPIDCTTGFTNKSLYQVTVLVGLSYHSKPICGFIAQPFKRIGNKDYYDPTVICGSTEFSRQCSYEYHMLSGFWQILEKAKEDSPKTLISCRCICEKQENLMKKLKLEPVKEGGCGYKCLKIIKNQASSVFLLNLPCSKWDTCAGQAIIVGMGGYVIKPTLQFIDYGDTGVTTNPQGFFMTTSSSIFQRFLTAVEEVQKDKQAE